jgi:hypothetical protein
VAASGSGPEAAARCSEHSNKPSGFIKSRKFDWLKGVKNNSASWELVTYIRQKHLR